LAVVFLFSSLSAAIAAPLQDYEAGRSYYLAAGACMAAYSGRPGQLAAKALQQEGWHMHTFVQADQQADARFFLAHNHDPEPRGFSYILAVTGTESMKDVKVDLRTDKVFFAGKTLDEFDAFAKQKDVPATEPKIHLGFHQYTQAILGTRQQGEDGKPEKLMAEELLRNSSLRVLLVGHSLGGAAVTIAAARLISMGVLPEQISVMTFGAPAVGNEAFRQQFEDKIDLTRVVMSGDEIPIALQRLVGGYKQFGKEVQWKKPAILTNFHPHDIVVYLDVAAKLFYDARSSMVKMGAVVLDPPNIQPQLCVAPVQNGLPQALKEDFPVMKEALLDEYRRLKPLLIIEETGTSSTDDVYKLAKDSGCRWLAMAEVDGEKIRGEGNLFQVTLQHALYRVSDRQALQVGAFGSSTKVITPLQALMHGARLMSRESGVWSGANE
jgi:hypothetical protein